MGWNDDRTSVGTKWGDGPTLVTAVDAIVTLPNPNENLRVFALDGKGRRTTRVPVRCEGERCEFHISAEHKTLWYEIARSEPE